MDNLPGGCKSMEEFSAYIHRRIEECMKEHKSKEETMKHLMDHFQIPHDMTILVWDLLEAAYPEHFISHYESCETHRKIREATTMHRYKFIPRWFMDKREIKQQRRSSIQRDDADAATSQAPRVFKSVEEFSYYVHGRIMECMRNYKSKEETVTHLLDRYGITPESTNTVWDRLEQIYTDNFRSYYEACEREKAAQKVLATARTAAETRSSSTSEASKTVIGRGLKDVKVIKLEKQRTSHEACENNGKLREQEAPKVTVTAQTAAETRSCKSSKRELLNRMKTELLGRGLKDMKVIKLEKQRTCPPAPGQSLMETGTSSRVPRLGPDAQANGLVEMNLEELILLLNPSRDAKLIRSK